jgi:GAF domain-containing protein
VAKGIETLRAVPPQGEPVRDAAQTLYRVINAVSSSLDLRRVLDGIVEIATEATDCHACFVYFVERDRLVLRAASPVYRRFVGKLEMGVDEGVAGWVVRNRTPELIRDHLLDDPRVKYRPELEEERFQSMVAVPLPSRSGEVLGVIVLHTAAPREFDESALDFLVHTASLLAGAIENAQVYEQASRRVDALTTLAELSQSIAAATGHEDVHRAVTAGARGLLGTESAHLYRLDPEREELELAASDPTEAAPPMALVQGASLFGDALRREGHLVSPLVASGEQLGLLCASPRGTRKFSAEEEGLFRAVADQAAVALKKAELIERLTAENVVRDVFEALETGAAEVAAGRAKEAGWDLSRHHVVVHAAPASPELEERLRARFPAALVDTRPEAVRALLPVADRASPARLEQVQRECAALATDTQTVVGIGSASCGAHESMRAVREAADAARIGSALRGGGVALRYDELGAYRYLVHLDLDSAPHDRYWEGVEVLLDYDERRRTHLVETLERYLLDRRSVVATARALYIHPNTVRQRLERAETLSGLSVADADLLSLELAIKLVRLDRATRAG